MYATFNELTLRITLDALFGFGAEGSCPHAAFAALNPTEEGNCAAAGGSDGGRGGGVAAPPPPSTQQSSTGEEASTIIAAVELAFEFFTKRAGAGMMLPEWFPTPDNVGFLGAVKQLDEVCV